MEVDVKKFAAMFDKVRGAGTWQVRAQAAISWKDRGKKAPHGKGGLLPSCCDPGGTRECGA